MRDSRPVQQIAASPVPFLHHGPDLARKNDVERLALFGLPSAEGGSHSELPPSLQLLVERTGRLIESADVLPARVAGSVSGRPGGGRTTSLIRAPKSSPLRACPIEAKLRTLIREECSHLEGQVAQPNPLTHYAPFRKSQAIRTERDWLEGCHQLIRRICLHRNS